MHQISGQHLVIDGYVNDSKTLEPGIICDLFDTLVPALNMKYLLPPIAMRVPIDENKLQTDEDEGGWSVICQITTSHIALHGWPKRNAVMMDIFSCRWFDVEKAKQIIFEHLGITKAEVKLIERQGPIR